MRFTKPLLNGSAIHWALDRIAHQIAERNQTSQDVVLVGIQKGGVHLASRLQKSLEKVWDHPVPVGLLDVSMHRDDHGQRVTGEIMPTSLPFDLHGKVVVLVDDVLFSGRTVRAAMDALTDFGRPKAIQLAVLVDRGNRELPIKADFVGKDTPTTLDERIDVRLREAGAPEDSVLIVKA